MYVPITCIIIGCCVWSVVRDQNEHGLHRRLPRRCDLLEDETEGEGYSEEQDDDDDGPVWRVGG